jgi:hypothetical protein
MAVRFAVTGGTWSSTSTWNDGVNLGIPVDGDDIYSNGFTVSVDQNINVDLLANSSSHLRVPNLATEIMTSNNTPSGIVTASSTNLNLPWFAFDGTTGTRWQSSTLNTAWLKYQFPTPKIIRRYAVVCVGSGLGGGTGSNIRTWTFEGSNDDVNWTILNTQTNITMTDNVYLDTTFANSTGFTFYRINISAVQTTGNAPNIADLQMTESTLLQTGQGTGGGFNLNTAGVTVSATSTSQGASNLFTVTNTTGTTELIVGNNIAGVLAQTTITHSSNGNFNITCPNLLITSNASGNVVLNKTGSGLLTVNGNCATPLTSIAGGVVRVLLITNGDCIVNGNVIGAPGAGGSTTGVQAIFQSSGTLTINGNVTPVGLSAINVVQCAVSFSGTRLILNGNTNGGDGLGIVSSGIVDINGTLRGGNSVYANNTITINITGDTYAGLQPAVNCSAFPSSIVNLTGKMYNNLGRMAIWCPNIFISNSATTLWRMDIGGGLTRTLYSADSFPNLPSTSDVRRLVSYGPASGLTGTMWVASPSDTRIGVLTDNTVGTADITATDILNFINTSSDPLAVRMRTMLTDNSAGQLISEYNFV